MSKVDEAIDDLEEVSDEYDLSEEEWESVDDASDYLFEHKVKKSWKDILKEWKPKKLPPKPKQIDVVLDYLSRNTDGATITNMVKDLDLHIRPVRLRKILEAHPKVELSLIHI